MDKVAELEILHSEIPHAIAELEKGVHPELALGGIKHRLDEICSDVAQRPRIDAMVCSQCGSLDVEWEDWVTAALQAPTGSGENGHNWCPKCEDGDASLCSAADFCDDEGKHRGSPCEVCGVEGEAEPEPELPPGEMMLKTLRAAASFLSDVEGDDAEAVLADVKAAIKVGERPPETGPATMLRQLLNGIDGNAGWNCPCCGGKTGGEHDDDCLIKEAWKLVGEGDPE